MRRIFLSYYHNLGEGASYEFAIQLISALRSRGNIVLTSPDPGEWKNWYGRDLPTALDSVDTFICVRSPAWDCSTWMAEEADQALRRYKSGRMKKYFSFDPERLPRIHNMRGMLPYLINPLPESVQHAVDMVVLGDPPI